MNVVKNENKNPNQPIRDIYIVEDVIPMSIYRCSNYFLKGNPFDIISLSLVVHRFNKKDGQ